MTNQPAPQQASQASYARPLTVPIYSTGDAQRFANSWIGACRRAAQALGRDHILIEVPQSTASAIQEALGSLLAAQQQIPILIRMRMFEANEVLWTLPDELPARRGAVRSTQTYTPQPQMTPAQPIPAPVPPPTPQPTFGPDGMPVTQTAPQQPQVAPQPQQPAPQVGITPPEGAAGTYKGVPVAAQQPSAEPGLGINDPGKVTRVKTKKAKNA